MNKKQPSTTKQLLINRESDITIREQLVTQLMIRISSGAYTAGDKLPSIRGLAKQLDIHYNTCLAVYEDLEAIGLVERKQGSGTRVKLRSGPLQATPVITNATPHSFSDNYFLVRWV